MGRMAWGWRLKIAVKKDGMPHNALVIAALYRDMMSA